MGLEPDVSHTADYRRAGSPLVCRLGVLAVTTSAVAALVFELWADEVPPAILVAVSIGIIGGVLAAGIGWFWLYYRAVQLGLMERSLWAKDRADFTRWAFYGARREARGLELAIWAAEAVAGVAFFPLVFLVILLGG